MKNGFLKIFAFIILVSSLLISCVMDPAVVPIVDPVIVPVNPTTLDTAIALVPGTPAVCSFTGLDTEAWLKIPVETGKYYSFTLDGSAHTDGAFKGSASIAVYEENSTGRQAAAIGIGSNYYSKSFVYAPAHSFSPVYVKLKSRLSGSTSIQLTCVETIEIPAWISAINSLATPPSWLAAGNYSMSIMQAGSGFNQVYRKPPYTPAEMTAQETTITAEFPSAIFSDTLVSSIVAKYGLPSHVLISNSSSSYRHLNLYYNRIQLYVGSGAWTNLNEVRLSDASLDYTFGSGPGLKVGSGVSDVISQMAIDASHQKTGITIDYSAEDTLFLDTPEDILSGYFQSTARGMRMFLYEDAVSAIYLFKAVP